MDFLASGAVPPFFGEMFMGNRSLAKRMNNYWINSLLRNFITIDLIAVLSAVILRCITAEAAHGVSGLLVKRHFEIHRGTGITYFFDGFSADLTPFFKYLLIMALVTAVSEIIMLAAGTVKGKKEAQHILKPIDEIAVSAKDIAEASITSAPSHESEKNESYSEMGLSDLQSAIDKLDPAAASHIHTGNSELKELEDAVNSLLDRMNDTYRQQAQFVSDASHELRTPLAVILGYAGMLSRWGKSDEKILDEAITAIKNESEHMTKLVEELLFLARGDNGRQTINRDIFSLSELISGVCSEYRLIDQRHTYICDVNGEFMSFGDASMIKQAARILTDNAKKYTPDGGEITLRVRRNIQGELCFEVQDTGIGIDQKDIEHIFERFYRADPARNRDTGGTGLGLSIAKWIVDSHGGRFEVSSCPGIGTRITVVLPKINPDSKDFILNEEKPAKSKTLLEVSTKR